jgi:signal transduction histidine kinase
VLGSIYDWPRRRPYVVDGALTAFLGLSTIPTGFAAVGVGGGLLSVGMIAPLFWRRSRPARAYAVVALSCLAQVLFLEEPLTADVAYLFILYSVSAYARQDPVRYTALGVGVIGSFLGPLDWGLLQTADDLGDVLLPGTALAILVAFIWTFGDLMRTRRAYVGELEERARLLEFERDQQARLARSAERARIARELHDVIAHSLSVVVAQADGGLYAGEKNADAARTALATIGQTSRQALSEMRRLLGVLRTEGEPDHGSPDGAAPDRAPQPSLAQLPDLIAQVRASGLPIDVRVTGDERPLAGGTELAAYRIVQEALTNTLKHGGPQARATVRLGYERDTLNIHVFDNGRGVSAHSDGQGHGIHGMHERIAVYGGVLRAGPRDGGGFEVVAQLPLSAEERRRGAKRE